MPYLHIYGQEVFFGGGGIAGETDSSSVPVWIPVGVLAV